MQTVLAWLEVFGVRSPPCRPPSPYRCKKSRRPSAIAIVFSSMLAVKHDATALPFFDFGGATQPCVATAIARWRIRRKGISKQEGTCHGRRNG